MRTGSTRRVVYTPASLVRTPSRLLRGMLADLLASRELAWRLFVRNISARYRQTVLGYVWALVPPVVTTILFVFLRKGGLFVIAETQVPYVVFLLTGMVLWQTFVDAVNAPLRMVAQSRAMLTKINFPREALILTGIAEVLFNFFVRLVPLVAVLAWYRILPPPTALLAPLGLLPLTACSAPFPSIMGGRLQVGTLATDMARRNDPPTRSRIATGSPAKRSPPRFRPGSNSIGLFKQSKTLDTST